ncbi:hypothetical protein [Atopobacter phocae]|uniref:hypothetical protein n=1 Tax=Atopobacter phocae TaxID=136492 RepID=UPI0004719EF2|nr:hypothetical protein [Atopobacter phocae]
MTFSAQLYDEVHTIWQQCAQHPFLIEMATGTLPKSKYREYMLQDYWYLNEYIKLYGILINHSQHLSHTKQYNEALSELLIEIEYVHLPAMEKLNITPTMIEVGHPNATNTAYTQFMLNTARTSDELTGLVILLNCSWAYAYLAKEVVKHYPEAVQHALYGEWFQSYVNESYQQNNQQLIDQVDALAHHLTVTERNQILTIFKQCAQYEFAFFESVYTKAESRDAID